MNIQLLRIILSTFPLGLALYIIEGLKKIPKKIFRKVDLSIFIFFSLYIFSLLSSINNLNTIGLLSESKPVIFILLLFLIYKSREKINNDRLNNIKKAYIVFGYLLLLISFFSSGKILRFTDNVPLFTHYLSVYFGVSLSILLSYVRNLKWFILGSLLVILNASGTGIIALAIILFYTLKNNRGVVMFFLISTVFLLASIFFYQGQIQRGRSIQEFNQIDRVVLSVASLQYLSESSWDEIFIGRPLSIDIKLGDYIDFKPLKEYITSENGDGVYPRNVHNEHLRLIIQFGLIGYFFAWRFIYKVFSSNPAVFWALFFSGFTNMVLSITPIIFVCLVASKFENRIGQL